MRSDSVQLFGLFSNAARFMGNVTVTHHYEGYLAHFYTRTVEALPIDLSGLEDPVHSVRLRVLDLCCGAGRLSLPIAEAGHPVTAVDSSPDMLALAPKHPRIEYVLADALHYCAEDRFDVVLIEGLSLLEFRPRDQRQLLTIAYHHLRPGGQLKVQTMPTHAYPDGADQTVLPLPDNRPGFALLGTYHPAKSQEVVQNLLIELEHTNSAPTRLLSSNTLHPIPSQTLVWFVEAAGFTVVELTSDGIGGPEPLRLSATKSA